MPHGLSEYNYKWNTFQSSLACFILLVVYLTKIGLSLELLLNSRVYLPREREFHAETKVGTDYRI